MRRKNNENALKRLYDSVLNVHEGKRSKALKVRPIPAQSNALGQGEKMNQRAIGPT
jgi:hypothetical protein